MIKKIFMLAVVWAACVCPFNTALAGAKVAVVDILAVGSYAGQINESESQPGLARFAAAIKAEQRHGRTLFVSTGNMLGGTAESELTAGGPIINAFSELKLSVMGVGAEDLKWEESTQAQQIALARYACLSLKPICTEDGKSLTLPYKIVKEGGIKLGFLSINKSYFDRGVLSEDNILAAAEQLQTYITALKNEGAEVVVLLTDIDNAAILPALAENLASLDLIIADTAAGDTAGVRIVASGQRGAAYAKIHLEYDKASGRITDCTATIKKIAMDGAEDAAYAGLVSRVNAKVSFIKQQEVGTAETEVWHNVNGVSLAGQFITDTVRNAENADLAFIFGDEIGGGLKKGAVRNGDLYTLLPHDDEVVLVKLSGREVKNLLAAGLTENSRGIIMYSGLAVCYDDNKTGQEKISASLIDGSALLDDGEYRTAVPEWFLTDVLPPSKALAAEYTGKLWRDYIYEYLRDNKINAADDKRLVIIAQIRYL